MKQGSQPDFDGATIYRWYVTLRDCDHRVHTVVTWAKTEEDARTKTAKHRLAEVINVAAAPAMQI